MVQQFCESTGHHGSDLLPGVSDHDLLFSQRPDDAAPSAEQGRQYVAQLEAAASNSGSTGGGGSLGARSKGQGVYICVA